jgi:threonine dehydrogenase-like Zn-dependent dehydrogenase
MQEVSFLGTRNSHACEFDEMLAAIRRDVPVEGVITHRFPLTEAEQAFDLFRTAECGKVILTG